MKKNLKPVIVPTMEQVEAERARLKYKNSYFTVVRSTVFTLVAVAAIAVLISTLWLPFLRIYGTSMTPTLTDGEIVCCVKTSDFETNDIVAFYYNNKILIKRVIGQAGDWINIDEEGNVYVNDKLLDEPYVNEKALGTNDLTYPYQVPDNSIFVLGDHRSTSIDSRSNTIGCISEELIVGKVWLRIWPLTEFTFIE